MTGRLKIGEASSNGRSLLDDLLRRPVGGGEPPPVAQQQAASKQISKPAYFTAVRTMEGGYWIDCQVNLRTVKGVRITNGERTIWLPRSQLHSIGTTRIRASDYIVNERYRDIIATDPDGVHEKVQKSLIGLKPVEWNHPGGDTR